MKSYYQNISIVIKHYWKALHTFRRRKTTTKKKKPNPKLNKTPTIQNPQERITMMSHSRGPNWTSEIAAEQ